MLKKRVILMEIRCYISVIFYVHVELIVILITTIVIAMLRTGPTGYRNPYNTVLVRMVIFY